ncbi:MAG: glycosyl hydrolase family 18 protein [Enterobacter sp.]
MSAIHRRLDACPIRSIQMGDPAIRATRFVASVKDFLTSRGKWHDGVDIDWEFPGGGGEHAKPSATRRPDKATYTALMHDLRQHAERDCLRRPGKSYLRADQLPSVPAAIRSKTWITPRLSSISTTSS